ncbi:DNA polymerase delta subunit 4 [Microdochium nivale]|nr:DNA polymerase delta subunit 4 [Microdochium nivale]
MPTPRRSSAAAAAPSGKQTTLSFNQRVTKAGPKATAKSVALLSNPSAPSKQSPLAKHVSSAIDSKIEAEDDKAAIVEIQQPELKKDDVEVEDEEVTAAAAAEVKAEAAAPEPLSESEVKALKVTDRQVDAYWRGVEAERIAKRVHQEDLGTSEKVLRYFDVSSQYGPCIGITRLRRWQRAERLGLNPPVEVLAVLLKGEKKTNKSSSTVMDGARLQMAHMDEILNSTAVSAS